MRQMLLSGPRLHPVTETQKPWHSLVATLLNCCKPSWRDCLRDTPLSLYKTTPSQTTHVEAQPQQSTEEIDSMFSVSIHTLRGMLGCHNRTEHARWCLRTATTRRLEGWQPNKLQYQNSNHSFYQWICTSKAQQTTIHIQYKGLNQRCPNNNQATIRLVSTSPHCFAITTPAGRCSAAHHCCNRQQGCQHTGATRCCQQTNDRLQLGCTDLTRRCHEQWWCQLQQILPLHHHLLLLQQQCAS